MGPRQVGKTTVLRHLSQTTKAVKRTYITLDDPNLRQLAMEDPALFLQRFNQPLLIDEIQYAPTLLPFIKMRADEERKMGAFWLTGSQQFHLMQGVTESLAGRVGIVNLLGLSLKEQQNKAHAAIPFLPTTAQLLERTKSYQKLSLLDTYQIIWRGSFPAICTQEIDRNIFYSSYIQTYLQRDVRDLANVGDMHTFLTFLRATAARTGQLLNMTDLARDCAISPVTAKRWLSILEASGIIYLLEPYHNNMTNRLIKTPKLYFLDTGLCAYLTEWSSPDTLAAGAMSGPILETFILTELLKSYWHNGRQAPFYYYRDKDKKEIDLLIIQDNTIYPIEFKKSASVNKSMVSSFELLNKFNLPIGDGGIICFGDSFIPLTKNISIIPIGML